MREIDVAGLTVRLAGGADREGGGDGPLVVLLHGFGAPGDDLVPLWRVVDAPPGTRWAFPAAPLRLPASGGGPGEARAWWPIDMDRRIRAEERGELEALSSEVPAGLEAAREGLGRALDALETSLRPSSMVVGGFSQGAMLACDMALRGDRPLAGLALLSGTLVAAHDWAALAPRRRGLPVFESHGTQDPLLPFAYAERLRALLTAGGLEVTWCPFRGGHELPDTALRALGTWLRAVT